MCLYNPSEMSSQAPVVIEAPRFPFARPSHYWPYVLVAGFWLAMLSDLILRALALAFTPGKTDFTELYVSAWLWRHGLNFYDSTLVTATAPALTGTHMIMAPVYPPTTLVAVSPFTFLPWGWANFLWLLLCLAAVGATIVLLMRLARVRLRDRGALYLITAVLAFSPLHQGFHLGNVVLLIIPLVLTGILLAETGNYFAAGIILGLATLLKPQAGFWILVFYALQTRKKFFGGAVLPAVALSIPLLWHPFTAADLASYHHNLDHWFGPDAPYGFTEKALLYHVNIIQVLIYQICGSVTATKFIAQAIFAAGIVTWAVAFGRSRHAPVPLAIASLVGLSFISMHHSVPDATILLLALCWALPVNGQLWTWPQRLTCVILFLMMFPGHSALMRLSEFDAAVSGTWWWKLLVDRYFVWLLIALNSVLLYGFWTSARKRAVPRVADSVAA
jgi:hypothetical protein